MEDGLRLLKVALALDVAKQSDEVFRLIRCPVYFEAQSGDHSWGAMRRDALERLRTVCDLRIPFGRGWEGQYYAGVFNAINKASSFHHFDSRAEFW